MGLKFCFKVTLFIYAQTFTSTSLTSVSAVFWA